MATIATPTFATPPLASTDETVAYIEQIIIPSGAQAADIGYIKRLGKDKDIPLTGSSMRLMPEDQIFMTKSGAALTVRLLPTNKSIAVRTAVQISAPDKAAYTVPSLRGLRGSVLTWFMEVLRGADQAGGGRALAASRAVNTGICYNETGKTNEPVAFQIPALAASRSVLAAGSRAIFVSWQGGAQPFTVTLSTVDTGRLLAQTIGVRDACAAYLPRIDLTPGHYRLAVTDANNVKEQEDNLFVAAEVPAEPGELREANLPEEPRQLYVATWLTVLDGGTWAFEAQQRVAAMDCRSAAAQDWLRQWGGLAPCVRTDH